MSAALLSDTIQKLAASLLEDDAYYIVGVELKPQPGGMQKVLVLADGDNGIGIDQITALSRTLGQVLEERELLPDAYTLEVSSPGVDYPLQSVRSYVKNIGRLLRVEQHNGHITEAPLLAATQEHIELEPAPVKKKPKPTPGQPPPSPPGPIFIPYADIKKAVVLIRF